MGCWLMNAGGYNEFFLNRYPDSIPTNLKILLVISDFQKIETNSKKRSYE